MLASAGQIEEAEALIDRALGLAPSLPDAWVDKVQILVEAGRESEIAGVLDRAARALPGDQATRTLAVCHATAGNDEEATRLFRAALDANPDDPPTIRLAAEHFIKVRRLGEVDPLIARIFDPRTRATVADLAWARRSGCLNLMRSGDQRQIDRAIALIDQNLKDNPFSFDDRRARAILMSMKDDRRAEAIQELEALDRSHLLGAADRFLLSRLYRDPRDWPKCQAQLLGLANERKPDPRHIADFVARLLEHGQLDEAERWLGEFRPADPSQDLTWLDLSCRLHAARRQDVELLALLREYAKNYTNQVGAVAELLERYGHLRDAEQAYRDYVAEDTKDPLRPLVLARYLARQGRVGEALDLCEAARKPCPPEPVAAACLAVLSSGKDVTDEQRERVGSWLEEALRRQPGSTRIRLALATVRSMQRRYDRIESIYRDVFERQPRQPGGPEQPGVAPRPSGRQGAGGPRPHRSGDRDRRDRTPPSAIPGR